MPTAAEVLSTPSAAASPAPASAPVAAPAAGLPNAQPSGWWDSVKDPEVKAFLANKNFPDAEHGYKAYKNLETLFGADKAGRAVLLPKDENDAEGWKTLASKLGVPEKPDDYKLPLPEGADDGFAKTAAQWFHEAGIPPRMANKVAEHWNNWVAEQVKAGEASDRAQSEQQMAALEKEWGPQFPAKRELAQRGFAAFAKQFGLDDKAALDRAESVLGAANLTRLFSGLGSLNAESGFAGSDGNGTFGMSRMTAQKEVDQIVADRTAGKINDYQWRTQYGPRMEQLAKVLTASG